MKKICPVPAWTSFCGIHNKQPSFADIIEDQEREPEKKKRSLELAIWKLAYE